MQQSRLFEYKHISNTNIMANDIQAYIMKEQMEWKGSEFLAAAATTNTAATTATTTAAIATATEGPTG